MFRFVLPYLVCLCLVVLSVGFSSAKTHRTCYTDAMVIKARQRIEAKEWAKAQARAAEAQCQWLIQMSDDDLWNFIPPAPQMRALNVNFGSDCPIHGAAIHRAGGHYPWIMSRDKPFKVECPVGHEVYPSNDFKPWWIEGKPAVTPENSSPTEKYVDNGGGWVNEKGVRYWFVPHYIFWQRWQRDVLPGVQALAQAYLLTDKPIYGHKCAVMLARLAEQYPQMNYLKQAYHHAYPTGVRGKILDYIWETGVVSNLSTSYDAAFPATDLSKDSELAAFLQAKGITDLRGTIEKNIISEMVDCLMNNTIRGNMGMPQLAMARLALVLDNTDPSKGHTTQELVDWILKTEPGKTTGDTDDLFYNGFYRDGHGGESSPGYSSGWCSSFYQVAEALERLGVDLWKRPKMKKMADILLDMTTAGKYSPAIGDAGSVSGAGPLYSAYMMQQAWLHYHDPIYAKVVKQMGGGKETLWEDSIEDKIDTVVKKQGTQIVLPSRNLGGYGVGILESGEPPNQRAVSMYYGSAAGGHGHRDRLTTEAWFFGKPMLPEHGYPAHWLPKCTYWTTNTISHYAVVMNRKWQETMYAGHLNFFAESPVARVMDASAEIAYPNDASLYRHTVAMVDASSTDSYLFDVWRVRGGTQHDWSFHGIPFADFTVNGLNLSAVPGKGTLAGEDVPFGDNGKPDAAAGFQYLFKVQKAYPTKPFTAMWKSTRDDTALNMTLLTPSSEIITADCEPELQPGAPETMKYVIARNVSSAPPFQGAQTKDGLDSAFAAVVEPIKGSSNIKSVASLTPKSPVPGFAGARVERENGVDCVLSNLDANSTASFADGTEFSGEFGVASNDYLFLVNGSRLKHGTMEVRTQPLTAKVAAVDVERNTVTLDTLVPINGLSGKVVVISNARHSTSYTIRSEENVKGKTVLGFGDVLPIIAAGHVTGVDAKKGEVTTDTVLTGYGRVDGGQHQGRWLMDSKHAVALSIISFDGKTFKVEGSIPEGAFGDGRFLIQDFHVADEIRLPSIQFVQNKGDGKYRVQTTLPADLTLPAAKGEHYFYTGKNWKRINARPVGGVLQFSIDPAQFQHGETILIIGKPAWMDLNDQTPPGFSGIRFDGKPVKKLLNAGPKRLSFLVGDAANPVELKSIAVVIDGAPQHVTMKIESPKSIRAEVSLPALSDGRHQILLRATDRSALANPAMKSVDIEILEPGNVALKSLGAVITVDSSYGGYESTDALHDGDVIMPGDHCLNDVSWASAETSAPHWIEVRLPKPHTIHRVAVYWAFYGSTRHSSRQYEIQSWDGKEWQRVAEVRNLEDTRVTLTDFPPVTTDRLRICQPAGMGHPSRPNLMWVGEVKVYEGGKGSL